MSRLYKNDCVACNDAVTVPEETAAVPAGAVDDEVLQGLLQPDISQADDPADPEADLENEVRSILDTASESGYAEGFEEGQTLSRKDMGPKVEEEIRQISKQTEEACRLMREENSRKCEALEAGQLRLALRLTAKILYSELKNNEDAFLQLFCHAASHIDEADSAVLKTGPLGYEAAQRHTEELQQCIRGVRKFEIKQTGINNGLCVIETPYGSVDASIDTQLGKAADALGIDFRVGCES